MSNTETQAVTLVELQEQVEALTAERDSLKGRVEAQAKELTDVRQEAADRRVKLREAQEQLEAAKSPEDFEALQSQLSEANERITATERELKITKYASNVPEDIRSAVNWPDADEEIQALAEKLTRHSQVPFEDAKEPAGGLGPRNDGSDDNESYDPRKLAAEIVR